MPIDSTDIDAFCQRFAGCESSEFRGQNRIVVDRESLHDALRTLRDEHGFDLLVDITCVDSLNMRDARDRFGLVYLLASTGGNDRLTVRCMVSEPDVSVPTVTGIWDGANWMEREVWDLYGIRFRDHSDLRRLMLYEEFEGHPLRKDYAKGKRQPLVGPGR